MDVPGTYRVDYRIGIEVLVLESNGTYHETYTYTDGSSYSNTGRWRAETQDGHLFVILDDAFIYGFSAGPPLKSSWKLQARREFFGGIVLEGNDPDDLIRLQKQDE